MDSGKGFDELVKKHNPGFDVVKDGSVFGASDHFSFYQQKIPVLFLWTGTHPDYHRPTDTSDKINVSGMKRITDYSERIIDELRTDPKRPEFVPIKSPFTGGGPKGPRMGILPDYQFGGKGVRVDDVSAGGPAEKAGLKKGDIIIEIAGKAVANVNGYMTALQTQKSGVTLEVKLLRDGKEMKLKVTPK
jgi:membrane-associated protease RseP (regulator of RpoE activity)